MRDLATGREPDPLVRLHVADNLGQYFRPAGPARDIRVELKRAKSRRATRLFVELIEHPFPNDQGIARVSRIAVAVGKSVAQLMSWHIVNLFLSVMSDTR